MKSCSVGRCAAAMNRGHHRRYAKIMLLYGSEALRINARHCGGVTLSRTILMLQQSPVPTCASLTTHETHNMDGLLSAIIKRSQESDVVQPEQLGLVVHSLRQLEALDLTSGPLLKGIQANCHEADARSLANVLHDVICCLTSDAWQAAVQERSRLSVCSTSTPSSGMASMSAKTWGGREDIRSWMRELVETILLLQTELEGVVDELENPMSLLVAESLVKVLPWKLWLPCEVEEGQTVDAAAASTMSLTGVELVSPSLLRELESRCESMSGTLSRPVDLLALVRIGKVVLDTHTSETVVTTPDSARRPPSSTPLASLYRRVVHPETCPPPLTQDPIANTVAEPSTPLLLDDPLPHWEEAVRQAACTIRNQLEHWDKTSLMLLVDILLDHGGGKLKPLSSRADKANRGSSETSLSVPPSPKTHTAGVMLSLKYQSTWKMLVPLIPSVLEVVRQRIVSQNALSPSQTLAWMHRLVLIEAIIQGLENANADASAAPHEVPSTQLREDLKEKTQCLWQELASSLKSTTAASDEEEVGRRTKKKIGGEDVGSKDFPLPLLPLRYQSTACSLLAMCLRTHCKATWEQRTDRHGRGTSTSADCRGEDEDPESLPSSEREYFQSKPEKPMSHQGTSEAVPLFQQEALVAYIGVLDSLVSQIQARGMACSSSGCSNRNTASSEPKGHGEGSEALAATSGGPLSVSELQELLLPLIGRLPEAALQHLAEEYQSAVRTLSSLGAVSLTAAPPSLTRFTSLKGGPKEVQALVYRFAKALDGACSCLMKSFETLTSSERRDVLSSILCWRVFYTNAGGAASQQWRSTYCLAVLEDAQSSGHDEKRRVIRAN